MTSGSTPPLQTAEKNASARQRSKALFVALGDFEFQTLITPLMLPTLYGAGILLAALTTLYCVVAGFRVSPVDGIIWLLVLGPALFFGQLIAIRIGLEVLLSLFRIAVSVERLDAIAHQIHGHAEEIATDLPRIRFWRSFNRPRKEEESEDKAS